MHSTQPFGKRCVPFTHLVSFILSLLFVMACTASTPADTAVNNKPAVTTRCNEVPLLLKEWEGCYLDNIADCETLAVHYDTEAGNYPEEDRLAIRRLNRLLQRLEIRIEQIEDQTTEEELQKKPYYGPVLPPTDTPQP